MPVLLFITLLVSLIIGILKLVNSASIQNTLAISLVWIVYNMIPQYLLIHYTWVGRGATLQFVCRIAFIATTVLGIAAMVLIWLFYPINYDYATGLVYSHRCAPFPVLHPPSMLGWGTVFLQHACVTLGTSAKLLLVFRAQANARHAAWF